MAFTSFTEINQLLEGYVPAVGDIGKALKLDRIQRLLEGLGNPQHNYRVIHVAGTSGKTSTSYYLASILLQTGAKVGLTVSPHVEQINERVQLGLQPLPEPVYCRYFSEFYALLQQQTVKPTYFELLVAFAYWVFAKEGVDYAVVEVGLGGLLDATNTVTRPDKVCVITDIALDHTHILGRTVPEIAAQKAGIIRPHNTVFMYDQGDVVMRVVREVADAQQAELHEIWPLGAKELPATLPLFQRRNWYLALSVCQYVIEQDGLAVLTERQLSDSTDMTVPGRMETITMSGKPVILDGAHNLQKIQTFFASYRAAYNGRKAVVLFALAQQKVEHLRAILEEVTSNAEHLIITSFDGPNDTRKRALSPTKIAEQCHLMGFDDWEVVADPQTALTLLGKRRGEVYIVIGSFYLVGKIKHFLSERKRGA